MKKPLIMTANLPFFIPLAISRPKKHCCGKDLDKRIKMMLNFVPSKI